METLVYNRIFFDSNHFGASSPRDIIDILEAKGVWARLLLHKNSQYQPRNTDLIINWGNPPNRHWPFRPKTLNPEVMTAIDKLDSFEAFKEHEVRCPPFTTDYKKAALWAAERSLVGRSLLRSYEGRGIVITKAGEPPARQDAQGRNVVLWTRYVPKMEEYRVHVFNGKAIDVAQKRKKHGVKANGQVRSYRNGWIFARENLDLPKGIRELGVQAVKAVGLGFGAVDIIWNQAKDRCYVLEVNTAPGLDGQTLHNYANAIKEYVKHA